MSIVMLVVVVRGSSRYFWIVVCAEGRGGCFEFTAVAEYLIAPPPSFESVKIIDKILHVLHC